MPETSGGRNALVTEVEKFLAEALDPNRTVLYCGKHFYSATPGTKPADGCVDCHKVFWMHAAASLPPHERREKLEKLQSLVRHMAEDIENGTFDFEFFPQPLIEKEN